MTPGAAARLFRWFSLRPHFRGKSRLEALLEPLVRWPASGTPVEFPDGFRMELRAESAYERSFYFRNAEPETYAFIRDFLRPKMVFTDCGANLGVYTLLASVRVGSGGHVAAFEPVPATFARLTHHLRLSGCANVSAHPIALGARTGMARVYQLDAENHGMNSLAAAGSASSDLGACEVRALDDLIAEGAARVPDLMKVDVEGFELPLLQGAERLLRERTPTLVIELSRGTTARFGYRPEDIVDYLVGLRAWQMEWLRLGRAYPVSPGDRLPHYAVLGQEHGANYVFRPA